MSLEYITALYLSFSHLERSSNNKLDNITNEFYLINFSVYFFLQKIFITFSTFRVSKGKKYIFDHRKIIYKYNTPLI